MEIEIKSPSFPDDGQGTVGAWLKNPGDHCSKDEAIVTIETDKVVLDIAAPENGSVQQVIKKEGDLVGNEEVIALFVTDNNKEGEHGVGPEAGVVTEEDNYKAALDEQNEIMKKSNAKIIKELRRKSKVLNIRANISLLFIALFISAGVYIFIDAGSIVIREVQPIKSLPLPQKNAEVSSPSE